jgi:hypothetical protein
MARAWAILRSPTPYAAWVILVLMSLWIGYFTDPYVFGIGTLILGWVSIPIAIAGLAAAFFSSAERLGTRRHRRVTCADRRDHRRSPGAAAHVQVELSEHEGASVEWRGARAVSG